MNLERRLDKRAPVGTTAFGFVAILKDEPISGAIEVSNLVKTSRELFIRVLAGDEPAGADGAAVDLDEYPIATADGLEGFRIIPLCSHARTLSGVAA